MGTRERAEERLRKEREIGGEVKGSGVRKEGKSRGRVEKGERGKGNRRNMTGKGRNHDSGQRQLHTGSNLVHVDLCTHR